MMKERWKPTITLKEFERNYIKNSNISRTFYNRWYITLPCNCAEDGCKGWAKISKSPEMVYSHMEFSSPDETDYLKYVLGEE